MNSRHIHSEQENLLPGRLPLHRATTGKTLAAFVVRGEGILSQCKALSRVPADERGRLRRPAE